MSFVQVIEFRTSKFAQLQDVAFEWEKATEGKRKSRRRLMCADRDQPGRFIEMVFFDSFEDAMENSELPEMAHFSQKMAGLTDGPLTFHNFDVVDERR